MESYVILPKNQVAAKIQGSSDIDAMSTFAFEMNADMNAYFKVMTSDAFHQKRLEQIGNIIDVFEDWLEAKGVTRKMICNSERDIDGATELIYGTDYGDLEDGLRGVLEYNVKDELR